LSRDFWWYQKPSGGGPTCDVPTLAFIHPQEELANFFPQILLILDTFFSPKNPLHGSHWIFFSFVAKWWKSTQFF
jgi:hypothetical protein